MPQEFADIGWAGPARAQGGVYSKRYLVWHATSNNAPPANECAFARTRTDGVGLHICADENVVLQALETKYATGHVGSTVGNHFGISFEMVGTDASPTAHWQAIIDRSAYAVREICGKWNIPARWLTSAQANDGVSRGWLTHDDARRYWGKTTHTDPGPNFPRQYALDAFNRIGGASIQEEPNDMQTFFSAQHPTAGGAKFFGVPGVICTWIQDNARIADLIGLSDQGSKWGIQLPPDHGAGSTPSVHHTLVAIAGQIPPGWEDHAIGGTGSVNAADVAAALAGNAGFVTAVANAVGDAVKAQFGPAFDARLTAAARTAVDARLDDDATT